MYHSSSYAAQTDAEWDSMRAEAVQAKSECKEACDKETAELNAL